MRDGKYRIKVEFIPQSTGEPESLVDLEFLSDEVAIGQERFLEPRYQFGKTAPVGYWDSGYSVDIKAKHTIRPSKPI